MIRKASSKRTKAISGGTSPEISLAAEVIANNLDLLTELLVRLPAKPLIRFKSVSKHWLSLISHPQFAANHSIRNPNPSISGFYYRLDFVSLLGRHRNLPFLSFLHGLGGKSFPITAQHSCNGLVLFHNCYLDRSNGTSSHLFAVCNPTTRNYTLLPKKDAPPPLFGFRGAFLAFDPSKSPHYKVLVVTGRYLPSEFYIFNSQTRIWKSLQFLRNTSCGRGVVWNSAIYWFGYDHSMWKFDVDAEKMIRLPLPPTPVIVSTNVRYFGGCGGGLILIHSQSSSSTKFQILELEMENSHWIVKYRVNLRKIVSVFPSMRNCIEYCVLAVVKSEKKEDYTLVLAIRGKVISYKLKSKTLDVLCDLVPGCSDVNGFACPFVETLSPV